METTTSKEISSAEAVFLGALASGVNGATWSVLKITFVMLGVCLIAMLSLAFILSDFIIVGNVLLLVIISAVLFILLNGLHLSKCLHFFLTFISFPVVIQECGGCAVFLAQTGLVSVEQQMEEMGMAQKSSSTEKDKNS